MTEILSELLKMLTSEGMRYVRSGVTNALTGLVKGVRRILLLHYLILMLCFFNVSSFFMSLYFIAMHFVDATSDSLILPISFFATLFVLSLIVLILALRERTWLEVLQIEEVVDACTGHGESSEMTENDIEDLIEKMVEKKLKKIQRRQS